MLPHNTGGTITWKGLNYVMSYFFVDYKSLCIQYSVPFPDLALCIRLHFFEFLYRVQDKSAEAFPGLCLVQRRQQYARDW